MRCAQKYGVKEIVTENDSHNAPMLAVNRKMGYRPWPGVFELKAELSSEA